MRGLQRQVLDLVMLRSAAWSCSAALLDSACLRSVSVRSRCWFSKFKLSKWRSTTRAVTALMRGSRCWSESGSRFSFLPFHMSESVDGECEDSTDSPEFLFAIWPLPNQDSGVCGRLDEESGCLTFSSSSRQWYGKSLDE